VDKGVWIAFGGLMFTILTVSGGGLWALFTRMQENREAAEKSLKEFKSSFDAELDSFRIAAYTEYKDIRQEYKSALDQAYLQLGEAPKALREKINEVELWMRDHLLPKKEYERDQDQLLTTINRLAETAIKRLDSIEKKMDEEKTARLKELAERSRG